MGLEDQLEALCAEWQRLARAEGEAIRCGDWAFLADCQKALLQLQPRLTPLLVQARASWRGKGQWACREQALQTLLSMLLQAEQENVGLLNSRRRGLTAQKGELEASRRNLRLIQKSYAAAFAPGSQPGS